MGFSFFFFFYIGRDVGCTIHVSTLLNLHLTVLLCEESLALFTKKKYTIE